MACRLTGKYACIVGVNADNTYDLDLIPDVVLSNVPEGALRKVDAGTGKRGFVKQWKKAGSELQSDEEEEVDAYHTHIAEHNEDWLKRREEAAKAKTQEAVPAESPHQEASGVAEDSDLFASADDGSADAASDLVDSDLRNTNIRVSVPLPRKGDRVP